jgi:hypothetical protein
VLSYSFLLVIPHESLCGGRSSAGDKQIQHEYGVKRDVASVDALGLNWTPSRGDGDEEEPVHGRPDHWCVEGAPGGNPDGRVVPQARDLGRDLHNWRNRFGGMEVSDARRLKGIEDENRRLKTLLAESVLDVSTLKEALGKF